MIKRIKRKIKRITGPKVLRKMIVVGEKPPRRTKVKFRETVTIHGDGSASIFRKMVELSGEIYQDIRSDDRVLIKVNLNTGLPFPASTDLDMLEGVVDQLNQMGVRQVSIGDCSSNSALPTRSVMKEKGIIDRLGDRVKLLCFDEQAWVRVRADYHFLPDLVIPEVVYEADKIIYLANVKTHRHADFSMGMKLAVGFMHPLQRYDLHADHLKEKVAEMCLAVQPDLIILDGRKPFIDGGPNEGVAVAGDRVIIGTHLLETDLAGYEYLCQLKRDNHLMGGFSEDPFMMGQFQKAREIFEIMDRTKESRL